MLAAPGGILVRDSERPAHGTVRLRGAITVPAFRLTRRGHTSGPYEVPKCAQDSRPVKRAHFWPLRGAPALRAHLSEPNPAIAPDATDEGRRTSPGAMSERIAHCHHDAPAPGESATRRATVAVHETRHRPRHR